MLQTSTSHSSSSRRRPLRRKNSAERQLDLKSLDDEAHKYFEEYVSISSHDCQGDSDDSVQEKENSSRRRGMKEGNAKALPTGTNSKGESQAKGFPVESDGVVLPWLQWEAEAGAGGDKNTNQVERNVSGKSNSFLRPGGSSSQIGHSELKNTSSELGKPSALTLAGSSWSSSGVVQTKSSKHMPSMTAFTLDDNIIQKESIFLDVDTLLFEKIKFRCRVENGELLLCQGLFLM
ncbi:hypothetical protein L7F22_030917 [Adiantum nelumboides]|nr:hypothetical protein [Adiantum nelumboides]